MWWAHSYCPEGTHNVLPAQTQITPSLQVLQCHWKRFLAQLHTQC